MGNHIWDGIATTAGRWREVVGRAALVSMLAFVLVGIAHAAEYPVPGEYPVPYPSPPGVLDGGAVLHPCLVPRAIGTEACPDGDGDRIPDLLDACPTAPGDLVNGCPRELHADIRGVWRVNSLFTKMLALSVRAPVGSRIDLRCRSKRRACPFKRRVVRRTTRRRTSLTRYFHKPRILPAGTTISVRVTLRGRIGTYQRLLTRRGRKLPKLTERCIDHLDRVILCP